jgi:hypothetical protein
VISDRREEGSIGKQFPDDVDPDNGMVNVVFFGLLPHVVRREVTSHDDEVNVL